MTVVVEFSNDNTSTWTYTPVSEGGGALAGYDRAVTHVRWRFTGNLSQTSPNNAGSAPSRPAFSRRETIASQAGDVSFR